MVKHLSYLHTSVTVIPKHCSEVINTKKLTIFIWSLVAIVVVFLILMALFAEVREPVLTWGRGVGGGTFVALEGLWAGIAATPIYQQFHVLIWVFGTIVLCVAVHQAHAANKLPFFKVKPAETQQAEMKGPTTTITREQPVATGTKTQPAEETKEVAQ